MEEIKVLIIVFNSGKVFILKEEDWDISSTLIDKTTVKELIHLETDCDFDVFLKHVYKIIFVSIAIPPIRTIQNSTVGFFRSTP